MKLTVNSLRRKEAQSQDIEELYGNTKRILFLIYCSTVTPVLSQTMQTCQQLRSKPELAYCSAGTVMPDVWARIYKCHHHTRARMHKHTHLHKICWAIGKSVPVTDLTGSKPSDDCNCSHTNPPDLRKLLEKISDCLVFFKPAFALLQVVPLNRWK